MTNGEIMIKAMKKARKNGWKSGPAFKWWIEGNGLNLRADRVFDFFIWDHDFAKAFWKEDRRFKGRIMRGENVMMMGVFKDWQFHLAQMVLEKEPIKYLEAYL